MKISFIVEDDNISEINNKYQIAISNESKGKISINNSYDVKDRLKSIKFVDLKKNDNIGRSYSEFKFDGESKYSIKTKKVEIIFKEITANTKKQKETWHQHLLRKLML